MTGRNKSKNTEVAGENKEKPIPAYLKEDYPYKVKKEPITAPDSIKPIGVLYEIRCPQCEMSIRSQGENIKPAYEKMMNGVELKNEDGTTHIEGGKGCIACGNRNLVIMEVDMSKAAETTTEFEAKIETENK